MVGETEEAASQYTVEGRGVATASNDASSSGSEAEDGVEEGEGQPTRSSKKRKRPAKISCEACKSRKVKCDRAEPACGWCARNNRVCVYKERKKPEFRAAHARDLEDKISNLEVLLHVVRHRLEDHILNHDAPARELGLRRVTSQPLDPSPHRAASRANVADATSQGTPASEGRWLEGASYPSLQYSRPSDAMSIQTMVEMPSSGTWARSEGPIHVDVGPMPPTLASDLPPYDLSYTLADLYFKHVNPWCPILDRAATFSALFGSSTMDESDRILLHAIVATTLRFSQDPRLTTQSRGQYHEVSSDRVQHYGLTHSNMRALQSLVILIVDVLGTSNRPEGWGLLALIAQNIKHLGLCTEQDTFLAEPTYASISSVRMYHLPRPVSWIENEGQRRLYWMVYVLDRYATLGTTFDFVLDERESTRALPCRYDLFSRNEPVETRSFRWAERSETIVDQPENLGSFSYHCEVLRILSRIHQFLRSPVDLGSHTDVQRWRAIYRELDGELNTWIHHLPGEYGRISQLCHSDPASRVSNWIMLHAAYVTSVVRLHSSVAYPVIRSHIFQQSYHASQRCLGAVKSLKEIAQDAVNTGMLDLLGHPFAFSLWVSARLLLVHAAYTESEVDPMINFFLSTLDQMGQYWPVARNYAEILNRVVQECQQNGSGGEGPRTLAGMRTRAYELSTALSKRPRSVLDPTTTRTPDLNELECLDVFEFFNYPRRPPASALGDGLPHMTPAESTAGISRDIDSIRDTSNSSMSVPGMEGFVFKPPHE